MLLLAVALAVLAPPLKVLDAKPDAAMNARFANADGWIGADDAYSIPLPDGRRLWLYADTWVGKIRDGKRTDATLVNNSLALQSGARVDYFIRKDEQGKPAAVFTPPDRKGWFWTFGGLYADGKLHIFLGQIERTDAKSVFGFRGIGSWMATIDNWKEPPDRWRPEIRKLPFARFEAKRELSFGSAGLVCEGWAYVFGYAQDSSGPLMRRSQIVARVRPAELADFSRWEFYGKGAWRKNADEAEPLFGSGSTELSVVPRPEHGDLILVYSENAMSDRILARTAAKPEGPWSEAVLLYRCPDADQDKRLFTYAAKAHAGLAGTDELLVSYVVNSHDFWQVAKDASLYWPKFVRVKLRPTN